MYVLTSRTPERKPAAQVSQTAYSHHHHIENSMGLDEHTALACERSVSIAFRIEPFRSIPMLPEGAFAAQ
jgi:hypothetical protein